MSIEELDQYFNSVQLPKSARLGPGVNIIDVSKFIESHIATLRKNQSNKNFKPYYDRLIKFRDMLVEYYKEKEFKR